MIFSVFTSEVNFVLKMKANVCLFLRELKLKTQIRSSRPEVFCKKLFLKNSQNSQENTCAGVCFKKFPEAFNFIKEGFQHRCFLSN